MIALAIVSLITICCIRILTTSQRSASHVTRARQPTLKNLTRPFPHESLGKDPLDQANTNVHQACIDHIHALIMRMQRMNRG